MAQRPTAQRPFQFCTLRSRPKQAGNNLAFNFTASRKSNEEEAALLRKLAVGIASNKSSKINGIYNEIQIYFEQRTKSLSWSEGEKN